MNFRDQLARVIARDSRYPIEAYAFVLESLKIARTRKLKERRSKSDRPRRRPARPSASSSPPADAAGVPTSGHVTGQEICHAARRLALRTYGAMALRVLEEWGIRSTSDIGEIVYNMIASGELTKTTEDCRTDFDNVYNFQKAMQPKSVLGKEPSN